MSQPGFSLMLGVAVSFLGALALTPLVRFAARRWGMVARPKADRWHRQPTALMGGVAIFVSVMTAELLVAPMDRQVVALLGASSFLFLVGLLDDLVTLKPYQKLAAQVLAALALIGGGLTLSWTGYPALNAAITLLWLVGITNAVNLLDNMDGLAAGITVIGCTMLGAHAYAAGQLDLCAMLGVFGAGVLGFLVYNSNPASIFMGDCGSLFLGSFLGAGALMCSTSGRSRTFLPVLAVPVLTLFIPIFDTLFVMVLRKLVGRRVSQGGRDHTSHRLVALGLTERRAVLLLYVLAALSGLLAILVRDLPLDVSLAAIVGFTIALTMLGFQLARVKVYDPEELRRAHEKPVTAFLVNLSYKRRVFEIGLDVGLISLSYYTAHALAHGPVSSSGGWERFLPVVVLLVGVKLTVFLAMGVYRGLWRYVSLPNLVTYGMAVFVASVCGCLALLAAGRPDALSRVVIALDGLLLLFLLSATRLSFRLLRRLIPPPAPGPGRRVLIFGAGDAGELLARELMNNPAIGRQPVGFVDDDPLKAGRRIHGLLVAHGNGSLARIVREQAVDEVLISSNRVPPARVEEIARACSQVPVPLCRLSIQFEPIEAAAPPPRLDVQVLAPARG